MKREPNQPEGVMFKQGSRVALRHYGVLLPGTVLETVEGGVRVKWDDPKGGVRIHNPDYLIDLDVVEAFK
jgi:hypothetical protein